MHRSGESRAATHARAPINRESREFARPTWQSGVFSTRCHVGGRSGRSDAGKTLSPRASALRLTPFRRPKAEWPADKVRETFLQYFRTKVSPQRAQGEARKTLITPRLAGGPGA